MYDKDEGRGRRVVVYGKDEGRGRRVVVYDKDEGRSGGKGRMRDMVVGGKERFTQTPVELPSLYPAALSVTVTAPGQCVGI